jgi:hypothetical protein
MLTDTQKRSRILHRIQRIPANRLSELDEFISKLEPSTSKHERVISYAGAWSDLEGEVLDELTVNLLMRRQSNKRRSNE